MFQFDISNFIFNIISSVRGFFVEAGSQDNPLEVMIYLFLNGGWIFFVIVTVVGLFWGYMKYIQTRYKASLKWTLLAIDIPKENLQSTKAVEQIFAAMWPLYESINLVERYIHGVFQQAFSLEIVSIGGYTQFLIRVPGTHKDIVEAAVYAQYPKAEITEVEDYTDRHKDLKFPSDEYDLWGTEFVLEKPSPYPIRTYPAFEHTLTQTFADPMASLLEVFSNCHKEEELWMQLVITPIKDHWKEEGYKIIDKIIGQQGQRKKGIMDKLFSPFYAVGTLLEELIIYGIGYEPGRAEKERQAPEGPPNKMLYLTPEEKNIIEGITSKISKLGYQTKLRMIYLGPKGKLVIPKGGASFIGVLQQFSTLDLNGFTPVMKTLTKANYFFIQRRVNWKRGQLLGNFRARSQSYGWGKGFVLNIEELASLFHLPIPEATREAVRQVEAKKEAPPTDLPDVEYEAEQQAKIVVEEEKGAAEVAKAEPPSDLPI